MSASARIRSARAPGLRSLQRSLAAHVLRGAAVKPGVVPGTRRFPAGRRLAIYRDGYLLRLTDALTANFPRLAQHLGAREFARLAAGYAGAAPSRSHSLRDFGHRLPAFLAGVAPWNARPELAGLARLEWAMAAAFDAPGRALLAVAALESLPPAAWPQLRFELHPSVRLLMLPAAVPALWSALEGKAAAQAGVPRGRGRWVVWRSGLTVRIVALDADEGRALARLQCGAPFAELCSLVSGADPLESARRAAGLLKGWIERGFLADPGQPVGGSAVTLSHATPPGARRTNASPIPAVRARAARPRSSRRPGPAPRGLPQR